MNEARIKLAETMGWRKGPKPSGNSVQGWYAPEGVNKAFTGEYGLPDPENDANDDCAVLEWARTTDYCVCGHPIWELIDSELVRAGDEMLADYKVGMIAKATLRVLGSVEDSVGG